MNAPVTNLPSTERRSVLLSMATKYNMEPAAFEQTLRATVVPQNTTREQFAAFLVVANEYGLNPLTKEIYAFPAKGGGIVPIVSVDGWCNLINSHPQLNGIEFDDHVDGDKVSAISARIWRKDRDKPIVVTEYLAECLRATEPWKQYPRRMLRHKALIQCARYAFGFAGIVDPDEAERMGADVSPMRDVSRRPTASEGPPPPSAVSRIEHKPQAPAPKPVVRDVELVAGETLDHETGEVTWGEPDGAQSIAPSADPLDGIPAHLRRLPAADMEALRELEGAFSTCDDMISFGEKQRDVMRPMKATVSPAAWAKAQHLAEDTFKRIQAAN